MAKRDKRANLLAMVPEMALRILDVGCAAGDLGFQLKQPRREIVGIEYDQMVGNAAVAKLDKVFIGDAECIILPYPTGYFDCILFADVLEHLRDPFLCLKKYRVVLGDQGVIVASIPNIRYYKVINQLLFRGTWDYTDAGILDKSHLRFFTIVNIKELFYHAGYEIVDLQRNIVASRFLVFLNAICGRRLNNLLTYQYYIKARKLGLGNVKPPRPRRINKF